MILIIGGIAVLMSITANKSRQPISVTGVCSPFCFGKFGRGRPNFFRRPEEDKYEKRA
jgi:hypothetical protein